MEELRETELTASERYYQNHLNRMREYSKKNNEGEFDIAYRSNLICSEIFDSIQEAKASALKRHQQEIELRANEIENYFKQFKD